MTAKPTGASQRYGLAHFHPGQIPQRLPETQSGGYTRLVRQRHFVIFDVTGVDSAATA